MSGFGQNLQDKCMNFSLRIVNLCHYLTKEKHEYNISNQVFRSGTSIGANVAEAQCAITRKDFILKIYIALKESNETIYWLELLYKAHFIAEKQFNSIFRDANELRSLLTSIAKTARKNEEDSKIQKKGCAHL